jgi:23S rRNA pseudouridine2605 synthase
LCQNYNTFAVNLNRKMGLRKRPYNEDSKGGKSKPGSSRFGDNKEGGKRTPAKRGFSGGKSEGRAPFKREGKSEDRDGNKRPGANRSFGSKAPFKREGRSEDRDGDRRPAPKRSFGGNKEGRAPFKRDGKFEDRDGDRRPSSGRGFGSKAPYKRDGRSEDRDGRIPFKRDGKPSGRDGGSYNRSKFDDDSNAPQRGGNRRSSSFSPRDNKPKRGDRDVNLFGDDSGERSFSHGPKSGEKSFSRKRNDSFEDKPRTSRGGRPYMVKGAKARDIKAKSEEKLDDLLPDEIRLNRYISNSGICSRREADDLISAGLVAVNGTIITEMGYKVKPGDEVRYNNERLNWEKKVYLLMNKPKDTITTSDDPDGRRIIMDLIKDPRLPRVYPVGRLDRNTTGVIILTNDGELAQRLTHPKYNITKVYKATLNKNFAPKDLQELSNNGVELEDGPIKPDALAIPSASEKDVVLVQIHSGRNRIIHRMFEAMGYLVDKLDRIDFAGLERKGLDRGEWKHLDDKEIKKLKKLVQLK